MPCCCHWHIGQTPAVDPGISNGGVECHTGARIEVL